MVLVENNRRKIYKFLDTSTLRLGSVEPGSVQVCELVNGKLGESLLVLTLFLQNHELAFWQQ